MELFRSAVVSLLSPYRCSLLQRTEAEARACCVSGLDLPDTRSIAVDSQPASDSSCSTASRVSSSPLPALHPLTVDWLTSQAGHSSSGQDSGGQAEKAAKEATGDSALYDEDEAVGDEEDEEADGDGTEDEDEDEAAAAEAGGFSRFRMVVDADAEEGGGERRLPSRKRRSGEWGSSTQGGKRPRSSGIASLEPSMSDSELEEDEDEADDDDGEYELSDGDSDDDSDEADSDDVEEAETTAVPSAAAPADNADDGSDSDQSRPG